MSDFDQRFAQGLNRMQHASGTVPAPQPAGWSPWQAMVNYLQGNPSAQALPTQQVEGNPAVDPYMNFARKATGQPYR